METVPASVAETPAAAPPRMTYEAFLDWAGEDVHAEWVKGEVQIIMTVSALHQRLVIFLIRLLQEFVERKNLGEVFSRPMQIKLAASGSGREPDVFYVAQPRLGQVREKYFEGAPDLVIEVISDESVSRDRVEKFEEYEDAGVAEYWLIDPRPRRRRADFYQLGPDGKYQPIPIDAQGRYASKVLPGLWIQIEWLWAEPLPKLLPTLTTILGE